MNRQVQNFLFIALALLSSRLILVSAVDSAPLQDFCVAVNDTQNSVNGHVCKDPKKVTADDFFLTGLDKPGNTSNPVGSKVTLINVDRIPGLNTLGISLGTFYVGFLASNPDRLISKVLRPGDLFVFPVGRIHFQYNIGKTPGRAVSGLSSQNPGIVVIANSVFGSNPGVDPSLLAAAFRMDKELVEYLQKKF
ncbi:Germin-like protein subfamily 1 member 18 [Linum grandiflorum]